MGEHISLHRNPVESSDIAAVLCYPRPETREFVARIQELASIRVDAIELSRMSRW